MGGPLLLFQEYDTEEGLRYMVWRVDAPEFLEKEAEYRECCESANEARRWALSHFIMQDRAELVAVTDMDGELFAANMREAGLKAKYLKD